MKNGPLALLAFLAVTSLAAYRPGLAADLAAVEAAVRKTDADWAAAARTASVDAWMAFYAADAVVLLPNDQLASDKELVRHSVSRLLALPQLSVAWSPIKVEVAWSGEQALLIEAYELRFGDPRGARVSERGRRLEIWRKQADGIWKCVVDIWNLDEPIAAASAAPLASAQDALPTLARPHSTAQPAPPPPTVGSRCRTAEAGARGGYEIRRNADQLPGCDPKVLSKASEVPGFHSISRDHQPGAGVHHGCHRYHFNARNAYIWLDGQSDDQREEFPRCYVGFKTYTFLFRGEKIVDVRLPLPGDEMGEPMPE